MTLRGDVLSPLSQINQVLPFAKHLGHDFRAANETLPKDTRKAFPSIDFSLRRRNRESCIVSKACAFGSGIANSERSGHREIGQPHLRNEHTYWQIPSFTRIVNPDFAGTAKAVPAA